MRIKENNISAIANNEVISYYNEIAANYENMLAADESNQQVRQQVAKTFCSTVAPGLVLDFGGGTGSDLDWLTRHHYNVIFCEPTEAMRQKAIDHNNNMIHNWSINFLEPDKTNFRNWKSQTPFTQKVDGVLANFAVFNCIPDIDLLFESLALITKPGAHLFALVLESSFRKRLRSNFRGSLSTLFNSKPVELNVSYKEKQHTAYIHSEKALRKYSAPYFSFDMLKLLPGGAFVLIHLIRK